MQPKIYPNWNVGVKFCLPNHWAANCQSMVWKISQRLKIICPPVLSSSYPTFSKQQSTWTARKQIPLCPASQSVGQGRKGNVNDVANFRSLYRASEWAPRHFVKVVATQGRLLSLPVSVKLTPFHQIFPYSFSECLSRWSWHPSTKLSLTVSVKGCLSEVDTLPPNFPLQFQWRAELKGCPSEVDTIKLSLSVSNKG